MVDTYRLTPAEPTTFVPSGPEELAMHLIDHGDIPEINVYQGHSDVFGIALDVAERIIRPDTDVRTLIGEYFTTQEVQVVDEKPTPEAKSEPELGSIQNPTATSFYVEGIHKGVSTRYVVGRSSSNRALQLR